MKKNFIAKLFFIVLLAIIYLLVFTNNTNAKATESIISKNFSEKYVTEESTDVWDPDGEILEYDAKTGKTTVVDMEKIKIEAEQISKKLGFEPGTTKPFCSRYAQKNTRAYNSVSPLAASDFHKVTNRLGEPYISICRVTGDGRMVATGFLVGPNLLLTSAHCIFDKNNNKYTGWVAAPAYSKGLYNNISSGWSKIIYPKAFLETRKKQDDWCLCILNSSIGISVGSWMGLSSVVPDVTLRSVGYPTDYDNADYQYYTQGSRSTLNAGYFNLKYPLAGGMSGGPTFAVANPTMAYGINQGILVNQGDKGIVTRITDSIINLVQENFGA